MNERLQLEFGLNHGLIDGVKAAWGARLIFPDDLVYDRHGGAVLDESSEEHQELLTQTMNWLNGKVDMVHPTRVWNPKKDELERIIGEPVNATRLGHARWKAHSLYETGEMTPSDTKGYVLYLDGEGAIIASPNGSHGYLYVAAYLYKALPSGGCTPTCDGTELVRTLGDVRNGR